MGKEEQESCESGLSAPGRKIESVLRTQNWWDHLLSWQQTKINEAAMRPTDKKQITERKAAGGSGFFCVSGFKPTGNKNLTLDSLQSGSDLLRSD